MDTDIANPLLSFLSFKLIELLSKPGEITKSATVDDMGSWNQLVKTKGFGLFSQRKLNHWPLVKGRKVMYTNHHEHQFPSSAN